MINFSWLYHVVLTVLCFHSSFFRSIANTAVGYFVRIVPPRWYAVDQIKGHVGFVMYVTPYWTIKLLVGLLMKHHKVQREWIQGWWWIRLWLAKCHQGWSWNKVRRMDNDAMDHGVSSSLDSLDSLCSMCSRPRLDSFLVTVEIYIFLY